MFEDVLFVNFKLFVFSLCLRVLMIFSVFGGWFRESALNAAFFARVFLRFVFFDLLFRLLYIIILNVFG